MPVQETNFALDPLTGDLEMLPTGQLKRTLTTVETVAQRVRTNLQLFQGEWFLNEERGVPYYKEILVKNPDIQKVKALLMSIVLRTRGIKQLVSFEVAFYPSERRFQVVYHAIATTGEPVEDTI